jgi:hypothetical protein
MEEELLEDTLVSLKLRRASEKVFSSLNLRRNEIIKGVD